MENFMQQELLIELVSDCNLNCKMCAFKSGFSHERMNNEIVKKIFEDIKYINEQDSVYHFTDLRMDGNSEPLLYPDIPFVIKCANKAGIKNTNITTNGVLLTRNRTDQLMQTNLTTLDISMTGIIPDIYKDFQGFTLSKEQLNKQIETIKENVRYFIQQKILLNKKITVTMRYIITPDTEGHFIDYINFFKELGVDAVMGMTLTQTQLRGKCRPYGEIIGRKSCESPEHPVICANGEVLMAFCPYDIPVIGNYLETSIRDIFLSEKNERLLKAFREVRIEEIPENCRNCYNTHIYRGGKW